MLYFSKPETIKFKLNISSEVQKRNNGESVDENSRFKIWKSLFCKIFCPNLLYKFEFDSGSLYKNAIQDGSIMNTSIKAGIT